MYNQEARGGMYSQAISTPIVEVSCYYNQSVYFNGILCNVIKVYILIKFVPFFQLNYPIVYSVGLTFDCNAK